MCLGACEQEEPGAALRCPRANTLTALQLLLPLLLPLLLILPPSPMLWPCRCHRRQQWLRSTAPYTAFRPSAWPGAHCRACLAVHGMRAKARQKYKWRCGEKQGARSLRVMPAAAWHAADAFKHAAVAAGCMHPQK